MCDKIREGSQKWETTKLLLDSEECLKINKTLEDCLVSHRYSWRECQTEALALTQCRELPQTSTPEKIT